MYPPPLTRFHIVVVPRWLRIFWPLTWQIRLSRLPLALVATTLADVDGPERMLTRPPPVDTVPAVLAAAAGAPQATAAMIRAVPTRATRRTCVASDERICFLRLMTAKTL